MGDDKKLDDFPDNSSVKVEGNIDQLQQIKLTGSNLHNDFIDFKKHLILFLKN